ncbi:probably inactive leucine-rich repeat receptor-like protein kinase At3g28040 [Helianthus annuus]|uniref:probably inactive leucine-rich repeat receptor-like protein kinase At3g28040 n=1 Tax=Helianthus annuus TaxID=4232 RepID=UPI000B8F70CA|nr:probably inactive leucine-rich repeat receptor-like protein kinase At3g28040 [Helianthus annuus]
MTHKCVGGGNLTTPACFEQERLALLKFKHSITYDNRMLSSWGVGNDCCRWERVGCDDATGRVISLHLGSSFVVEDYIYWRYDDYEPGSFIEDDYELVGDEVNSCLTELVHLKHLDLSGNYFQGSQIPEFIGSFKQLRYLDLSNVGFTGNIPHQIGNLSNLKVLNLHSVPTSIDKLRIDDISWIFGLSKLEYLDLTGVDLSRTQNVDSLLYTFPSLLKLSLSRCGVSIAHLGSHHLNSSRELANIKHLDLSYNDFKGQLPGFFLNMTSLAFLDLSSNDLSMAWFFKNLLNMIPSSVSELQLSYCGIQNINLSPTNLNFTTLSNIQHLDLSRNELQGRFPSALTNMSSLISLDLSSNQLNSSIPVMPNNLLKLDISWNKFRQIEDVGIWRHCNLQELIVSYNALEGQLISPSTNVSKCSQNALEILDLHQNTLNGSIPESIGRLTNLRVLDLSQNAMTGPIPVSVGRLTSLRVLSVLSNLLCGTIPNSIGQLMKLNFLDISNNSLQGVVSENHFANLSMLKYLDANSNDKLIFNISRGWMPPFQLKVARLGSCKIEGGFPQWFRAQRKLQELVLSNASIYGALPTWLRLLPMIRILDLSHNKLTGPLTNLPSLNEVDWENSQVPMEYVLECDATEFK